MKNNQPFFKKKKKIECEEKCFQQGQITHKELQQQH